MKLLWEKSGNVSTVTIVYGHLKSIYVWIIIIIIIINVEKMADKRGFVRRNRGRFNSNTGPSHTNKKLQEIYFEAARHQ